MKKSLPEAGELPSDGDDSDSVPDGLDGGSEVDEDEAAPEEGMDDDHGSHFDDMLEDEDDLIGLDELGQSDSDDDEEASSGWGGVSGRKRKQSKDEEGDKKKKKRKKMGSLPTFASYADYAKLIDEAPEEDL